MRFLEYVPPWMLKVLLSWVTVVLVLFGSGIMGWACRVGWLRLMAKKVRRRGVICVLFIVFWCVDGVFF